MRKTIATVAAVLLLAGPAAGQHRHGPTEKGYGGASVIQTEIEEGGSSLPFTGLDLLMLVVGGIGLICGGVALRKWERSRTWPPR